VPTILTMKVESLKTAPDRAGRYWVTFDDGSRMGLYRQTVEDFALYSGKELDEQEAESLRTAAGQMSAKMRAVRIVSAASVSRRDLEARLVRKGEDPQQAKEAVAWMEDLHLVDDRATAEQVVSSCISKGYGLARAKQALYEKRIPKEYWDEALADYPDQTEKITAFLKSRLDADSDEKQIRRAVDALIRRGHSYVSVRRALDALSFDTEDFQEEF
jgi:regulatory protein